MYVPLYLSWNKPTCYFNHAFHLNRATWWQLGLNSKEDICVTLCQSLVETGRAGLSQTPSAATRAMSSSCGNKCAHRRRSIADQREVQQRTVVSVTQGAYRLYCFISGQYFDCVWLLKSCDLGSLCGLTFSRKSTVWQEISSRLDFSPNTWSIKEYARLINSSW